MIIWYVCMYFMKKSFRRSSLFLLAEIRGRQLYFFSPAFQDFTLKKEIFNAKCLLKLSNDMEWNIGSLNKLRLFFWNRSSVYICAYYYYSSSLYAPNVRVFLFHTVNRQLLYRLSCQEENRLKMWVEINTLEYFKLCLIIIIS